MNVLISIRPKYVEEIKNGSKRYEFRRSFSSKKNLKQINKIFIYCTAPVKKIVARFYFNELIEDHPKIIWEKCKNYSGIGELEFFKYFGEKKKGFAIKISQIKFFKEPIEPESVLSDFVPPQSFYYIHDIEQMIYIDQY